MARYDRVGEQLQDNSGNLLISGFLKFEESGGGADKDTFSKETIDVNFLNPNPVELTASGRVPNIFYSGPAKVTLFEDDGFGAPGEQIEVKDPIFGVGGGTGNAFEGWVADVTYDLNDIVKGSDERFYKSIVPGNIANNPTTTTNFWMETRLIDVYDVAYTYQIGQIVVASNNAFYLSLTNGNINNDPLTDAINWQLLPGEQINFTPLLSDGTNSDATQTTELGIASIFGDVVFFSFNLIISALNSVSGTIEIQGFPKTANFINFGWSCVAGRGSGLNITAGHNITGRFNNNTATMALFIWDDAGGTTNLTSTEFSDTGSINMSGFYNK